MRVLDEDDQEVELRDLDEGEDDDVIHVDDLEKHVKRQPKEAKQPLMLKNQKIISKMIVPVSNQCFYRMIR